ncbi:glycosyltransferase family 2 protein [Flavobacterium sp. LAR06]|uniref:glycosyltransferase family 2 protein n=1 Tax=Flavobacterium sp. LAR06 TaxID=3064897 RepID=UPI0035BEF7E8
MNKPLVSIIIPTYNRANIIGKTLDSICAQTYQNWECIIIDDGSTDNTDFVVAEYTEKDSRFNYFAKPNYKPKGASSCRNYGLDNAKGRYIIFLDSDDVLLNFCVENRISKIQKNQENDFWVFPMFIQNENQNKHAVKIPISNNYLNEFLSYKIYWQTMCTTWDINFIKKLNGFNELYPRLNDPEVHIRAMILSKDHYTVFTNVTPDSIYMVAPIKDKNSFAKNYGNSLNLFVPDILKKLDENGLSSKSNYLKNYLSDYFLYYHRYNSRKNNLSVLKVFYKNKVISYFVYVEIIIQYYLILLLSKGLKKIRKRIEKLLKI